jgi:anaphase-promoting complex subunit 10
MEGKRKDGTGAGAVVYASKLKETDKREIGDEAVWSLSTAKPGNGVDQLRDDNTDTYWQSDGSQPHLINIQFHKKVSIVEVSFFLDYKLDESYTPKKLSLRAGTTFHDLEEVHMLELDEPNGWVYIPLGEIAAKAAGGAGGAGGVLRAHFLQIEVLAMHQNGRDTHIRQVKVYGPRQGAAHRMLHPAKEGGFSSSEFTAFSCIR